MHPTIPIYPKHIHMFGWWTGGAGEDKGEMGHLQLVQGLIKAQILTTIPENIAIKVQGLMTGKALWDALCDKHEKKVHK